MSETATDRLARMLALVPYISRRPGVAIGELATEFGVSAEQVGADLDLLMVCGLPGYYPDDLIDVVLDDDGGTVAIAFDAGIERPVRLDRRRGVRAHRRAARAGRAAGPGRRAGGALGAGQAGEGRRAEPGSGRRRRDRRGPGGPGRPGAGAGPGPAGARRDQADLDPLLHRVPGRGHRTDGRSAAAAGHRRALLPGGVLPPGRRDPALPGRPDRGGPAAGRARAGHAVGRLRHPGADLPSRIRRSRRSP